MDYVVKDGLSIPDAAGWVSGDYIPDITTELSIMFWCKSPGNGLIVDYVGGIGMSDSTGQKWNCFLALNHIFFEVYNGGGYQAVAYTGLPSDEDWHHYAFVFNDYEDTVTFYIDGEFKQTKYFGYSIPAQEKSLSIGAYWYAGNNYATYARFFDEVYLFKRVITDDEVSDTFDLGITHKKSNIDLTDCLGYWNFDMNALDHSGSGNDGTLEGTATYYAGPVEYLRLININDEFKTISAMKVNVDGWKDISTVQVNINNTWKSG